MKTQGHQWIFILEMEAGRRKRGASHLNRSDLSQKKTRQTVGEVRKPYLSNAAGLPQPQREEGNRELVNFVMMKFDAVRRRLSQLEDSKETATGLIKRADLIVIRELGW